MGDWSDTCPLWTRRMKAKVGLKVKDDGQFWISWQDFVLNFEEVYVCRYFDPQRWPCRGSISSQWNTRERTAGGCIKHPTVHTNPQWLVRASAGAHIVISLQQQDPRGVEQQLWDRFETVILEVYSNDGDRVSWKKRGQLVVNKGAMAREIHIQFEAGARDRVFTLLPCTYKAGIDLAFVLRWYATKNTTVEPIPQ